MARKYAFIIGNGLSAAFDPRLTSAAISERVFGRLSSEEQEHLHQLSELLRPESPDPALDVSRGDFEAIAGPVDRMADALLALDGLLRGLSETGPLSELARASAVLRNLYRRIVGIVLAEIDACCLVDGDVSDERRDAWDRLNAFAEAVAAKSGPCAPIYTTNYDSLLPSALLQGHAELFDGFPGGTLDSSLRCFGGKPALYHLHGSIAWTTGSSGELAKWDMATMRAERIVERWAAAEEVDAVPTVVLGDQKSQRTNRYPFVLFYEAFRRNLDWKDTLVAAGYSFGDRPVNAIVANYLAANPERRLLIWKRSGAVADYIARLRSYLGDGQQIADQQVELVLRSLPDVEAVEALE